MIIYKILLHSAQDQSLGAVYVGTQKEARKVRVRHETSTTPGIDDRSAEIEEIVIDRRPTKGTIISLLQTHASHADNG